MWEGEQSLEVLMASFREERTCAAVLRPRRSLLMHALRYRTRGGYLLARNTPTTDGSKLSSLSSRKVTKLSLIDPSSRFTHEPPPGLVSPARTTFLVFFLALVTNSPAKFVASPAISAANSTTPLELIVG